MVELHFLCHLTNWYFWITGCEPVVTENCWMLQGILPTRRWAILVMYLVRSGVGSLLNPSYPIIFCRKIAISLELNLRWTSDQFLNSSMSVVEQEKKETERSIFLGLIVAA